MGCNIHAHIEVKHDGNWLHFAAPNVARDYKLFNLIAAVRDQPADCRPTVCKHQGLPDDISIVTKLCLEQEQGYGAHHKGWLYDSDIRELQSRLYDIHPEITRTGIDELDLEHSIFSTYICGNSIASHDGFEDVRVVFWFDN